MGPPDRRRAGLAYAEMAHLALSHQIAHRPNRILDRHGRIDAVNVVEVDDIRCEPPQAALAAYLDVLRSAVRGRRAVSRAQITEFAGDHVLVAMTPDRASDQFLVAAPTICVRAVQKIDPDLARAAQGVDRRIFIGLVVERRHRRAAETDRGNLEPAEPAPLHPSASLTASDQHRAQYDRRRHASNLAVMFCMPGMAMTRSSRHRRTQGRWKPPAAASQAYHNIVKSVLAVAAEMQ